MKAKLLIGERTLDIDISVKDLEQLAMANQCKTGYDRVDSGDTYYFLDSFSSATERTDTDFGADKLFYDIANYYSDQTVAENNARADKLMRQMRRFAIEHRAKKLDWSNPHQPKYYIYFDYETGEFELSCGYSYRNFGQIHFDSKETAAAAIITFKDELLWYFTVYKDSL